MGRMTNTLKVLRNNWKKSVIGAGIVVYGINYGVETFLMRNKMRGYCEKALKHGDAPANGDVRRIAVILNPAANNKKAKKMFEKYCAPLLYLSGCYVSIIETEKEGHARDLVQKLSADTDAIIIAGGDGTISEAVTGLMRAKGELCKIPIGVLPLGKRNLLASQLFKSDESLNVINLANATLAVIEGNKKPIDAFKIEIVSDKTQERDGEIRKPVYGVGSVEWGLRRELRRRAENLWWLGPLSNLAPLVFHSPLYHTAYDQGLIEAKVRYSPPCPGCSSCYRHRLDLRGATEPETRKTLPGRWWNIMSLEKKRSMQAQNKNKTNYEAIVNSACNTVKEKIINTSDLCLTTCNVATESSEEVPKILLKIGPQVKHQGDLLVEGLKILKEDGDSVDKVEAKEIEITPLGETDDFSSYKVGASDYLAIDNEDYEVRPIKVTVLPNSVNVFCP